MSHRDDRTDPSWSEAQLDAFLGPARHQLAADIRRERRTLSPDFAAMIAAARAADLVSDEQLDEVNALAPVVELPVEFDEPASISEADLELFLADARAHIEGDANARRLAPIPPAPMAPQRQDARPFAPSPTDASAPASGSSRRAWLGPALALAAVLAGLVVVGPRVLDAFDAHDASATRLGSEAEYLDTGRGQRGGAHRLTPPAPPARERLEAVDTDTPPVSGDEPGPEPEPEPEPPRPRRGKAKAAKAAAASKPEPAETVRDRVKALDAEAQALWAEGDLEGARQRFRTIVGLAGKGRYAELAYGDLFTLARQRGDRQGERALWSEYLERFPQGRFVEDARAGLCRRSAKDARPTCWRSYLDDYPEGVHAAAAAAAVGDP
ncbi:hypothetical protein PPSIR1_03123 [Plesiocystis pacifica SIR-1]|uniref:Uncharacterized protein n=1 Tax=Plesiocystis pacifica SIR-1 TaxID=391625 RepID=A6GI19_9BACT|nr:hypothetical protein [Plesiocystis pacifica]EDM74482.1 hypothetical protein PPSIR1_03123 [Plesiocystis pacifica SIR-1]